MRRITTGIGPTGLPSRNQGGITPPRPAEPRGPKTPAPSQSANPRTTAAQTGTIGPRRPIPPPPGSTGPVPPKAIPRSRQDEIQRPILSPSTTQDQGPQGLQAPGQPAPEQPGDASAGLQMQQEQMQAEAALQGQQVAPPTPQEQEAQARAAEDARLAQPSKIPGIPVGTMEQIEKISPPSGTSEMKGKLWAEDRDAQLQAFGDFPGKGDPKAPAPPIRPFGRSFNPFTGRFTGERGPNAFSLMGIDMEKLKSEFYQTGGRGNG